MNIHPVLSRVRLAAQACAFLAVLAVSATPSHAQGCVPVKQMGDISCSLDGLETNSLNKWSVNFNYQGFRSHRHFVGHDEQEQRYLAGSEVINVVNQLTTTINYTLNSRTSFSLNVPYFHAVRSSLYEHRGGRFTTSAAGIGDISIGGQMWVRNTMGEARQNIAFGLGLQLPTGNSNAKDDFHAANGLINKNVDQSIQLGEGGWGVAFSFQSYQRLGENTTLYATGFYLVTPQEMNGTFRSTNALTGRDSVFDAYNWRAGVTQMFIRHYGFSGSLGLRQDGVPALDLVGGSKGFRRPGYTISVEPGIAFMTGHDSFSLSVPVAVDRSRSRSYSDILNNRHGDAAFADFLINFNYSHHW
jgi:hypothetical protein